MDRVDGAQMRLKLKIVMRSYSTGQSVPIDKAVPGLDNFNTAYRNDNQGVTRVATSILAPGTPQHKGENFEHFRKT